MRPLFRNPHHHLSLATIRSLVHYIPPKYSYKKMDQAVDFKIEYLGKPVSLEMGQSLKDRIHELTGNICKIDLFPGMQPTSFQTNHIELLKETDYHVCEKSDGIRVLGLMIFHRMNGNIPIGSFFITDRKYEFREIAMAFPCRDLKTFHNNTIVDGELVLDNENGKKVLRLYIFDLLVLKGHNVMDQNLNDRFNAILKEILNPFNSFYEKSPYLAQFLPFGIIMKEMFKAYHISYIFNHVISKLPHENDGLIFTPVDIPYKPGTCDRLLKWKPKEMNTVDFKIGIYYDPMTRKPHFKLFVSRYAIHDEHVGWLTLEPEIREQWIKAPPVDRIVECRYDPSWETIINWDTTPSPLTGGWRFVRFRDDKPSANDIHVYHKILDSIRDGVSKEELIQTELEIRKNWEDRHKK